MASENSTDGVQLWENGPYWAECNIGATKPEDPGYYFWWGDTIGYKRNSADDGWASVKDGSAFEFDEDSCPTCGKKNSQLQSEGYIDSTGNLVAAHDAATAHLGALWRMPTESDFEELEEKCDVSWATQNGVIGYVVTGRGDYASKSIFLPVAGWGEVSELNYLDDLDSDGIYWSSTPDSGSSSHAWGLYFDTGDFYAGGGSYRYYGRPVRPLRD